MELLLIENDSIDVRYISSILNTEFPGINITTLLTKQDFVTFMESADLSKYSIIVTDFSLHVDLTGLDVVAKVKELNKNIPIIVISGAIGEENAVLLMKSGADDFVLKQNLSRLPEVIRREVENYSTVSTFSKELSQATDILLKLAKSSRFILTHKTNEISIDKILQDFGEVVYASKVCLYEKDSTTYTKKNEWCDYCTMCVTDEHLDIANFIVKEVESGRNFDTKNSDLTDFDRIWLRDQNIMSMAAVPIIRPNDQIFGILCFYNCRIRKDWTTLELTALQNVGQLLGIVVSKKEQELEQALKERQATKLMSESNSILDSLLKKLGNTDGN